MKFYLAEIKDEERFYEGDDSAEMLDMQDIKGVTALSPVHYSFYIQSVDERIIVRGRITVEIQFECARCCKLFSTTIHVSSFLRDYVVLDGMVELDIGEDMREDVLLEFPHYPHCDEACKGRCPVCGCNLND